MDPSITKMTKSGLTAVAGGGVERRWFEQKREKNRDPACTPACQPGLARSRVGRTPAQTNGRGTTRPRRTRGHLTHLLEQRLFLLVPARRVHDDQIPACVRACKRGEGGTVWCPALWERPGPNVCGPRGGRGTQRGPWSTKPQTAAAQPQPTTPPVLLLEPIHALLRDDRRVRLRVAAIEWNLGGAGQRRGRGCGPCGGEERAGHADRRRAGRGTAVGPPPPPSCPRTPPSPGHHTCALVAFCFNWSNAPARKVSAHTIAGLKPLRL